jgi:hypothetical protein
MWNSQGSLRRIKLMPDTSLARLSFRDRSSAQIISWVAASLISTHEGGPNGVGNAPTAWPQSMSDNDDNLRFSPPKRSTGSRGFLARSKASARGFLLAKLPAVADDNVLLLVDYIAGLYCRWMQDRCVCDLWALPLPNVEFRKLRVGAWRFWDFLIH